MKFSKVNLYLAAASLALAGIAHAGQIGSFQEINGTDDFSITTVGGTTTFAGSSQVYFTFSNTLSPNPLPGLREATLTWIASSTTPGTDDGTYISQGGYSGTFIIIDNVLLTNLLSGVFGSAGMLSGPSGGHSGTYSDATPPSGEVSFSSDYLDFSLSTSQAIALSLSNLNQTSNPALGLNLASNPGLPVDATAVGTGTFSADPLPQTQVPEPATMAMLGSALIAFGAMGRKIARR